MVFGIYGADGFMFRFRKKPSIATLHVRLDQADCGTLTFTYGAIRAKVREELSQNADHIAFLPFADLKQSVLEDIHGVRKDIESRSILTKELCGAERIKFSGGDADQRFGVGDCGDSASVWKRWPILVGDDGCGKRCLDRCIGLVIE
ncbi:uncharacterized protein BDV17DRAFT_296730 [Aspergillus undulatus]|uniref:uncharacterized protein n=1 Tax=Aspergillus undulatus TaxID=1810928 RepID=UPI003CCE102A